MKILQGHPRHAFFKFNDDDIEEVEVNENGDVFFAID